jgi:hypothetical protein
MHSPFTAKRDADLVHLLGGNIVDGDDEDGLVPGIEVSIAYNRKPD